MKQILLICAVVALVGCGEEPVVAKKIKSVKAPAKELTKEDIVGEYEITIDGTTMREVFLENGIVESYGNGKLTAEGKWKIVDGEIHVKDDDSVSIAVYRINTDKSITWIADIDDGKRTELSNRHQATYKKIK